MSQLKEEKKKTFTVFENTRSCGHWDIFVSEYDALHYSCISCIS